MKYKDGTEAFVGDYCRFPMLAWNDKKNESMEVWREGVVVAELKNVTNQNARVAYVMLDKSCGEPGIVRAVVLWITMETAEKVP